MGGKSSNSGSLGAGDDIEDLLQAILDQLKIPTPLTSDNTLIGCIFDDDRKITGIVTACKKPALEGVPNDFEYWAFIPGSPPIQGYEGPWEPCDEKQDLVNLETMCY